MKTISKYIYAIMAGALVVAGLASCDSIDYPDRYKVASGKPTVYSIRYADQDITIDGAYMDEIICLLGDNLRSIKELYFNDQKAILNTSYITDNTLIIAVPSELPTVTTNKIYMINKDKDTTTYDFTVRLPSPKVSAMSFEYAEPGETVTITGNYFLAPFTVEFTGGATVSTETGNAISNISLSSFDIVIPEDALPGKVKVTTESGTGQSTFNYKDERGILFDFDGVLGLATNENNKWHSALIQTDETTSMGNFVQLGNGTAIMSESGGWDDNNFAFEFWCGSWDTPQNVTSGDGIALNNLVDFSDYSNMSLKFEMYIPSSNPWMAGAMQICFEGYDMVTISGNEIEGWTGSVASANAYAFNGEANNLGEYGRAIYRPWETTGSYDTADKWITVTIPISDFKYNKDGGSASTMPDSPDDFASLTIFVVGGGLNGTECTPIIKIDNIRAVSNK